MAEKTGESKLVIMLKTQTHMDANRHKYHTTGFHSFIDEVNALDSNINYVDKDTLTVVSAMGDVL
jgi:hypothetical protein